MKNKVYKVSQELADYVREFENYFHLDYAKNDTEVPGNIVKEVCNTSDFPMGFFPCLIELWYADQYGYMEVVEDLYYVELVSVSDLKYLNQEVGTGTTFVSGKEETRFIKTKFTLAEIKAIDERYLPFAVKVDE